MAEYVVRELCEADVLDLNGGYFKALRRFRPKGFTSKGVPMTPERALAIFKEDASDKRKKIFVVEVGSEIVATATAFWRISYIHPEGVGYLEEVATCEDKEGHGYGAATVKAALKWFFTELNLDKVILNCEKHNVDYYREKLGFFKKDQGMRLDRAQYMGSM